jgi:hypothetical protein
MLLALRSKLIMLFKHTRYLEGQRFQKFFQAIEYLTVCSRHQPKRYANCHSGSTIGV